MPVTDSSGKMDARAGGSGASTEPGSASAAVAIATDSSAERRAPEFQLRRGIGMKIGGLACLLLVLQAPVVIVAHMGLRALKFEVQDMTHNDVPALQLVNDLKNNEMG